MNQNRQSSNFREEVEQTFNRWFPEFANAQKLSLGPAWPLPIVVPAVDVLEREDELVVRLELPGVEAEKLSIEVHGSTLFVRGEKEIYEKEVKDRCLFSECRFGAFDRSVILPCRVDTVHTHGVLNNGVLTIHLRKSNETAEMSAEKVAEKMNVTSNNLCKMEKENYRD